MVEYEYSRELLPDGRFDIDNPNRVDAEGHQIFLAKEVYTALSQKPFGLICDATTATFSFEVDLTTEEKTTLDTTVSNHKNNT